LKDKMKVPPFERDFFNYLYYLGNGGFGGRGGLGGGGGATIFGAGGGGGAITCGFGGLGGLLGLRGVPKVAFHLFFILCLRLCPYPSLTSPAHMPANSSTLNIFLITKHLVVTVLYIQLHYQAAMEIFVKQRAS
jgi:hypothetical protein